MVVCVGFIVGEMNFAGVGVLAVSRVQLVVVMTPVIVIKVVDVQLNALGAQDGQGQQYRPKRQCAFLSLTEKIHRRSVDNILIQKQVSTGFVPFLRVSAFIFRSCSRR